MVQFCSTSDLPGEPAGAPPTLNLEAARTFVAICETSSFRRAAQHVHKSPSAVSLQINKLESQVGAVLLLRNARRVVLTEQGELLLGFARRLLAINDQAAAAFRQPRLSGRLSVAAPHDLGVSFLPGMLRRLAEVHPNVSVEVRLGTGDAVQELFTAGQVNLALFNESVEPSIKARELSSERLCWLMQNGGNAVTQQPLPLAVADIGCAWREVALDALQRDNKPYRIAYLSDTSAGQVAAVRADLAVSALPLSLSDQHLVEVPAEYEMSTLGHTHTYIADDGSDIASAFAHLVTREHQGRLEAWNTTMS